MAQQPVVQAPIVHSDNITIPVKDGISIAMVRIEAGTFTMGATAEMKDPWDNEKPTHRVTLTNDYYIGKYEVTQALWKAVMGNNPSKFKGDNLPVEWVCWDDCQEFISKLNRITGKTFRLPTEAEWEYAARGGNKSRGYQYSGSNNLSDVAWFMDNSGDETHAVGTKQPNELGIYDMSGNVWEWCQDRYGKYNSSSQVNPTGANSGSERVNRGGGWDYYAIGCRSSLRDSNTPSSYSRGLGLRLVLSE
ncbi:formylglycine-generating enzyme family protein [Leyella stercorea]|nr:formylglycine-generating enzyme family protein [Leyella stercorea]